MIVAVIPARGGSKRIPGKNSKLFCGKPILQYSIDAALQANLFDYVMVSTDCPQLAELAIRLGAEVPFLRPASLADDFTPTIAVIRQAIAALEAWPQRSMRFSEFRPQSKIEFCCCLYPTAPFIQASNLRRGFEQLRDDGALDFALTVTTYAFPVFRAFIQDNQRLQMLFPEHEQTRSQDLPEVWHDAGQFYWGRAEAWKMTNGPFSAASAGIPIPRMRVQDIDTPEDWERAELMYQTMQQNSQHPADDI